MARTSKHSTPSLAPHCSVIWILLKNAGKKLEKQFTVFIIIITSFRLSCLVDVWPSAAQEINSRDYRHVEWKSSLEECLFSISLSIECSLTEFLLLLLADVHSSSFQKKHLPEYLISIVFLSGYRTAYHILSICSYICLSRTMIRSASAQF